MSETGFNSNPPTPLQPNPNAGLEKLLLWWDGMKRWFSQAGKLGLMMARGAYLIGERQRVLGKLGEQVFEQMKKGSLQAEPLKPLIENIERLTQNIEAEEQRIQEVRNSGLDAEDPVPPQSPTLPLG